MTVKKKERKKIMILSGVFLILLAVLFMTIQYKKNMHEDATCSDFSNTGGMIMKIRQTDLPQERVIDALLKEDSDESLIELVNTTVSEAYDTPLHDSVEDKEKAIADFKETSYDFCRDSM